MARKQELASVDTALVRLEEAMEKYGDAANVNLLPAARAVHVAQAMKQLEKSLTPEIMSEIMPLMNSSLGFRTDRNPAAGKKAYSVDVVKKVLVEAIIWGVMPTGNELNIIAGNCYIAKAGFWRKVREFPGLTDLQLTYGVPAMKNGGALVDCSATWRLDGKKMNIGLKDSDKCVIPIRVNSMMGTDAIIGKCERKLLARIWNRVSGSKITMPEGDVDDLDLRDTQATVVEPGPSTAEKLKDEIKARQEKPMPKPKPEDRYNELEQAKREKSHDILSGPPEGACTDYCEIWQAMYGQRKTPGFVKGAIKTASEQRPECEHIKKFCDIDYMEETQCGLIRTEFARLRDTAKSGE